MQIGTSYYPEMIDRTEWKRDLDLMREAGMTLIRMLDFAWTRIEPREGIYTFDWLDSFLDLCQQEQMQVILCTPTATPPAWLAMQYPEIMVELSSGEVRPFGGRRDVCNSSPIFRHFSRELACRLGERYGRHPAVIGWQIDNELIGAEGRAPECHCRACQWMFRDWLKRHYAGVNELNAAWGTVFWNQEYSDWGEIGTPRNERCVTGQVLDYARFFNESQVQYIRVQYDALRHVIDERQWISHNSTGVFDRAIDHIEYAKSLDITGWDAYYRAAGDSFPTAFASLAHDMFRSALHKPFVIFESGVEGGYSAYWAEMAARGASALIFWHWRMHRANSEKTGPAVCDHNGDPIPSRYDRIRDFARTIKPVAPRLPASLPKASVALVYSQDCVRAWHRQYLRWDYRNRKPVPYLEALIRMYEPFWRRGVPVDVVRPGDDLSGYSMAVMPAMELLSTEQTKPIRAFVIGGGVLVACSPLAHFDDHGVYHRVWGEPTADVTGATALNRNPRTYDAVIFGGEALSAPEGVVEQLEVNSGEVIGEFVGISGNAPAVVRNSVGQGISFYMACSSNDLADLVIRQALQAADIACVEGLPEGVSACRDIAGAGIWLLNHRKTSVTVQGQELEAGGYALLPSHEPYAEELAPGL